MTKLLNTIALVALAGTIYSAEKQDSLDIYDALTGVNTTVSGGGSFGGKFKVAQPATLSLNKVILPLEKG